MTRVISRALAALAIAAACLALAVLHGPPASASSPKIGPNQYYTAAINGSTGQSAPVSIGVFCPGPAAKTGHPLPDQTIAVSVASSASTDVGKTGPNANSIAAFFGAPPPAPASAADLAADTNHVVFTHYRTLPLPHSLVLPCGGSGTVTFLSLPLEPQTSVSIPVTYVSPAAAPRR